MEPMSKDSSMGFWGILTPRFSSVCEKTDRLTDGVYMNLYVFIHLCS